MNKYIYMYTCGGQNYLRLAKDMVKVSGPLWVAKVFTHTHNWICQVHSLLLLFSASFAGSHLYFKKIFIYIYVYTYIYIITSLQCTIIITNCSYYDYDYYDRSLSTMTIIIIIIIIIIIVFLYIYIMYIMLGLLGNRVLCCWSYVVLRIWPQLGGSFVDPSRVRSPRCSLQRSAHEFQNCAHLWRCPQPWNAHQTQQLAPSNLLWPAGWQRV